MYNETKKAVRKSFEIGKILFSMGSERYNLLLKVTSEIKIPKYEELFDYIEKDISFEDAMVIELKKHYKEVARNNGFSERQAMALLEYAAMLKEIE
jgi:hypothetical protein